MTTYVHELNSTYYMRVAGTRTPGITEVDGNSGSPRKWDEMAGYGLSGSTLRFTGLGLAKFDSITELYSKEELEEWKKFFFLLAPPKRARPRALDVWHPKLEMYTIASCVVLDVALPKVTTEGVTQILINWQAYRAVKFSLSKIEGAKDQPADEFERQIQDASKRLEAAARG